MRISVGALDYLFLAGLATLAGGLVFGLPLLVFGGFGLAAALFAWTTVSMARRGSAARRRAAAKSEDPGNNEPRH